MKILFDANLSPALVTGLRAEYPGSTHVRDVGLRIAPDAQIWEYAKAHGFGIASKDTDFRELSFLEGFPPKVIWLDVGNAGTASIVTKVILGSKLDQLVAARVEGLVGGIPVARLRTPV